MLLDCSDLLGQVRHLAVDHYSFFRRPQRLDELLRLLTGAGFRMHFRASPQSTNPFLFSDIRGGVDAQLQIFAFRD